MDKVTLSTLKKLKQEQTPISMLTCYDYSTAVLLQKAGVDSILVGDTLAQMVLGHENTLPATMDLMVALTSAVKRGAPNVYLVADMPFLSYQVTDEQALTNAARFLTEASADTVKIEVDHRHLDLVNKLTMAGIPVMAHLGFRPQSSLQTDKIVQTRSLDHAKQLIETALQMIDAGVSSLLLECVTTNVAKAITERTDLPVISCGSGPHCDGQVLVLHEILDMPGSSHPKFTKVFSPIGNQITEAAQKYAHEVQQKKFPDEEHSYHMPLDLQMEFEQWLKNMTD